ncbi:uncharacterized protein L203_100355 [Cryptococcus depauperatus CBS 7841]|uniref:UDP-glucose:glycoprotein glucosyltransferase n=1 Tax=Cryptococcus depauperatus CBS 7841 TaxID=1295531 RepID=A0AAJ8LVT7_9TREE
MRTSATWVALGLAASTVVAFSPPVHVNLETAWPAPPLLLEILETVYDEEPQSYFPLLNLISSLPTNSTPEAIFTSTLDLIQAYSLLPSPASLSTFHLALSLHSTAPRIEAGYNWYETSVRRNEASLGVEGCQGWVEWRGKGFCDAEELRKDMQLSIEEKIHKLDQKPSLLPFDRIAPSQTAGPVSPQAVIYYTPEFKTSGELLNYLAYHASQYPEFTFIVRYLPPLVVRKSLPLAGWGVEMALKRTDYLVVDDRTAAESDNGQTTSKIFTRSKERDIFSHVLGDDPWSDLSAPLSTEEIEEIGLYASALIMSSNDPLDALIHLSQDFPKYSAALARQIKIPEVIKAKGRTIAVRGRGKEAFYVNGKSIGEDLNVYKLLDVLRRERQLALSLTCLGLTPAQSFSLLSDPVVGQMQAGDEMGENLVDASDRLEGGDVVVWWNDIEKDKRYRSWPKHVEGYMRPLYPGQYHTVRQNTFNLIFVLDLSRLSSLDLIASSVSTMIQRGIPIRFGIVPTFTIAEEDDSVKTARLFWYIVRTFGRGFTREFLQEIIKDTPRLKTSPDPKISLQTVKKAYDHLISESSKPALPFEEIVISADWDHHIEKTAKYLRRLLVDKSDTAEKNDAVGGLFINGKFMSLTGNWPAFVSQEMQLQLSHIQEQILAGTIPENVSTLFYDLPTTAKRRSAFVVPNKENKLEAFNLLEIFAGDVESKLGTAFIYPEGDRGTPISMWIIGNLDSEEGREMAKTALKHLQTPECASRLGFIHTPTSAGSCSSGEYCLSIVLYQLVSQNALALAKPADLLELISDLENFLTDKNGLYTDGVIESDPENPGAERNLENDPENNRQRYWEAKPLHAMTFGGWTSDNIAKSREAWTYGNNIARKLGIRNNGPHILVNGRLVGPVQKATFPLEDFDALEVYEHRKRVKPVIDLLKTMYDDITVFDKPTLADLISKTSSVLTAAYKSHEAEGIFVPVQSPRTRYYEKLDNGEMSFKVNVEETALLRVAVVMNPVSETAQKWASIIKTLAEMPNISISVYLEPEVQIEEIKLKRFYRSSVSSRLSFDVDGEVIGLGVTFDNLPSNPIYTMGLDIPPAWIVSPKTSLYDLDNLQLSSISNPISIFFQLKQLLIEGHAREDANVPPRGLQLQIIASNGQVAADTQVMANLGYLQFRAKPGYYSLSIRPGRGREVYELASAGAEGWDSPMIGQLRSEIALGQLEGQTIYPVFKRKEGMEKADVLAEVVERESFSKQVYGRMKSLLGLSSDPTLAKTEHAEINIFTVASGLLYERFVSIMVLSVMKHTNSSVKFWFIEIFLSPSFIDFLPKFAEEYGFQYEFVTYKWPHWLRAQNEKQRIIWAYKILFLDVLFPMSLEKVIFVDADQIIRTDMKELVDVDLHGRVYGYPPMGNSRTEMEGFRFWKSGYWKEALRGRPYHISALYVVDLKRFRQLATGDRLRGQYHALSADPNSLANLDQDLPNSMQDQIPIWTLDQDWLWCQTWCSDESLETAKTIDLCQNPLTKEPKLVRARQIPEWDSYDREIATFASRVFEGAESGALAADIDELNFEIKEKDENSNREGHKSGEMEVESDEAVEKQLHRDARVTDEL